MGGGIAGRPCQSSGEETQQRLGCCLWTMGRLSGSVIGTGEGTVFEPPLQLSVFCRYSWFGSKNSEESKQNRVILKHDMF